MKIESPESPSSKEKSLLRSKQESNPVPSQVNPTQNPIVSSNAVSVADKGMEGRMTTANHMGGGAGGGAGGGGGFGGVMPTMDENLDVGFFEPFDVLWACLVPVREMG